MSLPQPEPGPTVVVCEDDLPTLELLCDHLERRPLLRPARPERRRRAAPLPLQAARPAAARPQPARRLGARGAARDPRHRRRDRRLRPGAAGDRAQRARRATPTASAACDCGADDYVDQAVRRRRGGRPDAGGAAPPRRPARRARCGSARSSSTRRGARSRVGGEPVQLANKEFTPAADARRASPTACSPRPSCCATSGAFARWAAPARSTRTRAGCGASSTPRRAATSSTAGASATG